MNERFVSLGCLIVRWIDVLSHTHSTRRYRGIDRDFLSWSLAPDNTPPGGCFLEIADALEGIQDVWGFIPDIEAARLIYGRLRQHDQSYELIACSIEPRVLQYLDRREPSIVLGGAASAEEVNMLRRAQERLLARPPAPAWDLLGYDVARLGLDFYSPVFHELTTDGSIAQLFPQYREQLNVAGLFGSAEVALEFLKAYQEQPDHEEGDFFIYEVAVEPLTRLLRH
jgi:hypothetical protein